MTSVTKTLVHKFVDRMGPLNLNLSSGSASVQISWVIEGKPFPTLRLTFIIYKIKNLDSKV